MHVLSSFFFSLWKYYSMDFEEPKLKDFELSADEENDSPVEQVRLTVPTTDDPKLPCLTFRTWAIGLISCAFLAFMNQFFSYRNNPISIGPIVVQILALPVGKLMAKTLPRKSVQIPKTKWSFSLNPGPFNLKEHVLITIFANCGYTGPYAINIITIVKAKVFYNKDMNVLAGWLLSLTTQMLGYGWAGTFRRYLVDSPYMWWPGNLVQVSLFSALHQKEKRRKGRLTRLHFFFMVTATSFAYYIVPNYLFPSITALSFICWIWKDSVTAHQIGAANTGLGIGSFAFDWATVTVFTGDPLSTPGFAILNTLIGFFLVVYVATPLLYWNNVFEAKRFPLYSTHVFDSTGSIYNLTRILNKETFDFNTQGYEAYSKVYLSIFFAFSYGLGFATLAATVSHVGLFYGRSIISMLRQASAMAREKTLDVHGRLMRKYETVPQWWFQTLLVVMVALSIITCEGFGKQLQLPWWGVLLACAVALLFTLPIAVIAATTNQEPGLNVITELMIGYIYPGKPLANVVFKTYGYISMTQAVNFLSDFKLGYYMKIPPKAMFHVQLVGTLVSTTVYYGTAWWLLTSIKNICDPANLPEGSPWTCPGDDVFYNASIIWGVVSPKRMFGSLGLYRVTNWFFLIGFLAPVPVFVLSKIFPDQKWIRLINMPVILGATLNMPPARAVNFITYGAVGLFFSFYVYRKHKGWWARHNYILSAGLQAGIAFMTVLAFFSVQMYDVSGVQWWGLEAGDHCPLSRCPTAPGIVVKGCPVF